MILVMYIILVAAVSMYIILPFAKDRFWPYIESKKYTAIASAKKEGIWAISDVDNEYELGKLTDKDYETLRKHLKAEVFPVLKKEKELLESIRYTDGDEISLELKHDLYKEVIKHCGE